MAESVKWRSTDQLLQSFYLEDNAHLIIEFSQEGGILNAANI